jgi:ABC-type multidrug transport system fused ATPase/permease subunit
MDADLIVVMDDGAVVEQGTHDYLLSVKGRYCELWDAQTREKGEAVGRPDERER